MKSAEDKKTVQRSRRPKAESATLGNIAALVRATATATATATSQNQLNALDMRRQIVADFCKLIGARLALHGEFSAQGSDEHAMARSDVKRANRDRLLTNAAAATGLARYQPSDQPDSPSHAPAPAVPRLSRRTRQTLSLLLAGDSEKQIAGKLGLSRHTVHVYVKTLYRGFEVNSRGELLARFVGPELPLLRTLQSLENQPKNVELPQTG